MWPTRSSARVLQGIQSTPEELRRTGNGTTTHTTRCCSHAGDDDEGDRDKDDFGDHDFNPKKQLRLLISVTV